jgi:hypothetical protein
MPKPQRPSALTGTLGSITHTALDTQYTVHSTIWLSTCRPAVCFLEHFFQDIFSAKAGRDCPVPTGRYGMRLVRSRFDTGTAENI